jgi:PAS domain S-box-containing protein
MPSRTSHSLSTSGRDQHYFFKQVAELTPEMLYVLDLDDHEIIFINEKVRQVFGAQVEQAYQTDQNSFVELVHPGDYERRVAHMNACKALLDQQELTIDVRLKPATGKWRWFRIRDRVLNRSEDGRAVQLIGTVLDVHEEKKALEKLKQEHFRLKQVQALGHIGSFEQELPGEHLQCSEECFQIHGLAPQPEGIPLQTFMSFVHPNDREASWAALRHTYATGEPLKLVHRIVGADGIIRHVRRKAELMQNAQGLPVRMCGLVQDISESVAAEEQVIARENLMRQAEAVGRFGSYELNIHTMHLKVSDGFYSLFGYEPRGFESSLEFVDAVSHPDDDAGCWSRSGRTKNLMNTGDAFICPAEKCDSLAAKEKCCVMPPVMPRLLLA